MSTSDFALDSTQQKKFADGITQVAGSYQKNPDLAMTRFSVNTRVVKGFETQVLGRGFTITIDEPESLGGTNKGMNPVEVLLGTLGTCHEIVLVAYAAVMGITLESVNIEVSGDIDLRGLFNVGAVPSGFKAIHFAVSLRSPNGTPEQLEQLKTLALNHCPVLDTLQRPIPVTHEYAFNA